jgi:hypothetical protein
MKKMNRENQVLAIYRSSLSKDEKIRQLQDIILDLNNELAAVDQNMHPDVYDKMAEGLRLATNFLRELTGS